jgi:hypothetical protein
MKIGNYAIDTDLPWRSSFDEIEEYVREVEEKLAATNSMAEQRDILRDFVEQYLKLRSKATGLSYPIVPIMEACDHKQALRLYQEVAGFA